MKKEDIQAPGPVRSGKRLRRTGKDRLRPSSVHGIVLSCCTHGILHSTDYILRLLAASAENAAPLPQTLGAGPRWPTLAPPSTRKGIVHPRTSDALPRESWVARPRDHPSLRSGPARGGVWALDASSIHPSGLVACVCACVLVCVCVWSGHHKQRVDRSQRGPSNSGASTVEDNRALVAVPHARPMSGSGTCTHGRIIVQRCWTSDGSQRHPQKNTTHTKSTLRIMFAVQCLRWR